MAEISTEYFIAKRIKLVGLRYFVVKYRCFNEIKLRCYELAAGLHTAAAAARKYAPFVLCLPSARNAYL